MGSAHAICNKGINSIFIPASGWEFESINYMLCAIAPGRAFRLPEQLQRNETSTRLKHGFVPALIYLHYIPGTVRIPDAGINPAGQKQNRIRMKTRINPVLIFALELALAGATLTMAQPAGAGPNVPPSTPKGPCDIYAAAGDPCVAAHSTTRTLYASYKIG